MQRHVELAREACSGAAATGDGVSVRRRRTGDGPPRGDVDRARAARERRLRKLVERVVDWSRAYGRSRVVLSVEGDNGRAARLYEKCGFVELEAPPPLPYEPGPGNRFYAYML